MSEMSEALTATQVCNRSKRKQWVQRLAGTQGYPSIRAFLIELYVTRRMSMQNIAGFLGMSFRSLRELMLEHDVPIRELGERLHNNHVVMTPELYEEICTDGVALTAFRLNVDPSTVRHHLLKWVACLLREGRSTAPLDLSSVFKGVASTPVKRKETKPSAKPVVKTEKAKAPAVKPEPEVYFSGRRVTQIDVVNMLRYCSDEERARYERAAMCPEEAYERARVWLRQTRQFG